MASLPTLIASLIGPWASPTSGPTTSSFPQPGLGPDLAIRELHPDPFSTYRGAIQGPHSIFSVPVVFKLYKSKPGWIAGDPYRPQRAVVAESPVQILLHHVPRQVSHVDLAVEGSSSPVSRHFGRRKTLSAL